MAHVEYEQIKCLFTGLQRNHDHAHESSLGGRLLVNCSDLFKAGGKALKYLTPDLHVAHLTSSELDNGSHLVALGEESLGVICLCLEIVCVDTAGKLNLLQLGCLLLFLCFLFPLLFVETEFAEIHDAAYRGVSLRRHHNQIKSLFISQIKGLAAGHDAELLSVLSDESDLLFLNVLIDKRVFFLSADKYAPPNGK